MKNAMVSLLGAVALLVGCGGGSDGPSSCPAPAACGGNLAGTWKITSSCVTSGVIPTPETGCAGETARALNFGFSGTVVYSTNGTYTANTATTGDIQVTIPASCLSDEGSTCAETSQGVMSSQTDPSFASGSCASSGANCVCTLVLSGTPATETGTWSVSNGTLTQAQSAGDQSLAQYCVQGNTLTLSPQGSTAMLGSTVMETITLVKQ